MSASCLEVISNKEVLGLATTTRAPLVYQWPLKEWPNAKTLPGEKGEPMPGAILNQALDAIKLRIHPIELRVSAYHDR